MCPQRVSGGALARVKGAGKAFLCRLALRQSANRVSFGPLHSASDPSALRGEADLVCSKAEVTA
jgi:hypothetical protein